MDNCKWCRNHSKLFPSKPIWQQRMTGDNFVFKFKFKHGAKNIYTSCQFARYPEIQALQNNVECR